MASSLTHISLKPQYCSAPHTGMAVSCCVYKTQNLDIPAEASKSQRWDICDWLRIHSGINLTTTVSISSVPYFSLHDIIMVNGFHVTGYKNGLEPAGADGQNYLGLVTRPSGYCRYLYTKDYTWDPPFSYTLYLYPRSHIMFSMVHTTGA